MKNKFKKYSSYFNPQGFVRFIEKHFKKAGVQTIYTALLMYFAFQRKETSGWAKNIILGCLGYLIAPIDGIPDLTPVLGLTDDIGVLSFGLVMIACYINNDVRVEARKKLSQFFKEYDTTILEEIDRVL